MITSYTTESIRMAEDELLARTPPGELMLRAAEGASACVFRELKARRGKVVGAKVLMLVGPGNNGGDGLFAGARMQRRGVAVTAITVSSHINERARAAFERDGGRLYTVVDNGVGVPITMEEIAAQATSFDIIIDALYGIGARSVLSGHASALVTTLTVEAGLTIPQRYRRNRPLVIAIDVPSGIGVNEGSLDGQVLQADVTVTFGAYKPAAILPPASDMFGRIELVDIGLVPVLAKQNSRPAAWRLTADDAVDLWPLPDHHAHKYTRGVLGVIAGSDTYPGAAVLTTAAAVSTGLGMVRYLGPEKAVERVLARRPEVVPGGGRVDAWALGPGVAAGAEDQRERIRQAFKWSLSEKVPTVVDAGAFSELPDQLAPWMILTPHAGELSNLLADRGLPIEREKIERDPVRYTRLAAEMSGATVLLKGPSTVIAGQDDMVFVQHDGTPWLSTAGAGDVLTGILGAILAGHGSDVVISPEMPARLAALAAMVHGRAALSASCDGPNGGREDGTTGAPIGALDVIHHISPVIGQLLNR